MSEVSRPLRVGVAGLGFGTSVHIPALRRIPGVEVVGLAGRDAARAAVAASNQNVARSFDSLEGLLDLGLDAVTLALPPLDNEKACWLALERGIAVFSEKPLTYSSAAAAELTAAASGKVTAVDFEFAELACFKALKQAIDDKRWGEVKSVDIIWHAESYALRERLWSWKTDAAQCSGVLSLLGSHSLYLLEWLFGAITDIEAMTCNESTAAFAPPRCIGAPDLVEFSAHHASGLRSVMSMSNSISSARRHQWIVRFDDAEAVLLNESKSYLSGFHLVVNSGGITVLNMEESTTQTGEEYLPSVSALMGRFVAACRKEAHESFPDFAAGARTQALMAAIEAAAAKGSSIAI